MMPQAKAKEIAKLAMKVKTSDEVFEIIRDNVPADLKSILF
jgi:hypothetical protein